MLLKVRVFQVELLLQLVFPFSDNTIMHAQFGCISYENMTTKIVCVCILKGDVQMSVTVVSVLWEKIHESLPESMMVQWFMSYIG